jgi:chromosome segregation protein
MTAKTEFEKIKSFVATQELDSARLLRSEAELTVQVTPLREELAIAAAVLKRTELEAMTIEGQLNESLEKIGRLERAKHNITIEKDREAQLMTDAENVLIRIKHELSDTETAQDDEPEEIDYLTSRVEVGKKELLEVESELDNLRAKISELTMRNQSLNENVDRSRSRKDRLEEQYITINEQQKTAQQAIDNDLSINLVISDKQKITDTLLEAKQAVTIIDEKLHGITQAERNAREESMNAEAISNKLSSQIKGLAEIVERTQVKGTAKTLEKIIVSAGYEKAFGVIFGEELNFDDDTKQPCFWGILNGDNTHITLPPQAEPLSNFVKVPEFLQCSINRVGVVNSTQGTELQKSLPAGGILVSKCGKLWRSDGFTALASSGSAAAIMLEQRNKLAQLRQELLTAETITLDKKNAFHTITEQHKTLQTQEQQLRNHLRECEKHQTAIEKRLYEAENNLKIKHVNLANIVERRDMVEKELNDSQKALDSALSDLEKITGTDDLKAKSEELKTKVTDKRMALADTRALLETKKRSGIERAGRIKTLKKDLSDWHSRYDNASKRVSEAIKKLQNIDQDLSFSKKQPAQIEKKQKNITENLSLAKQRHSDAEEKSLALEGELSVISKNLRQLQSEIAKNREIMIRCESQFDIAQTKEAEILMQIQDKVNGTPDNLRHELEFDETQSYPDVFTLEEECKNLNRVRDASGAVNLLAEQELTELESESLVMITEKNDLVQAMQKLNAAIKDINQEGREKILIAFEQVNENFQHLFKHLFSGGTAELKLVESDDPLEAGLEIMAQPPGKKTASLSLLSGGEQALTCMALIFAVFLTNPSPICVLDEVDAPLDDANVERYCNLINEMTNVTDTRFLVITHHSLTMARTDRLFGVTMAERGVSQLVSVDLKAAERLLDQAA